MIGCMLVCLEVRVCRCSSWSLWMILCLILVLVLVVCEWIRLVCSCR